MHPKIRIFAARGTLIGGNNATFIESRVVFEATHGWRRQPILYRVDGWMARDATVPVEGGCKPGSGVGIGGADHVDQSLVQLPQLHPRRTLHLHAPLIDSSIK